MKVRWKGKTEVTGLIHDKVYEVISIEKDWYRIIDESGEDYLYPPDLFEIVEELTEFVYTIYNSTILPDEKGGTAHAKDIYRLCPCID